VPADAGLLSALGLGHAVIERFSERQILQRLDRLPDLPNLVAEMEQAAVSLMRAEGVPLEEIVIRRRIANLRFVGQDFSLDVDFGPEAVTPEALLKRFEKRYRLVYGHWPKDRAVEVESLRVIASSLPKKFTRPRRAPSPFSPEPRRHQTAYFGGQWREVPVFDRFSLQPGAEIRGPALIFEKHSACVVERGWQAQVDPAGALVLRAVEAGSPKTKQQPEAVRLELFTNRFESVAREMGAMLQRTAISTNVKERLDFSCALLDADGYLVVNAPHIPVHLGAIGLCVRRVKEALALEPGDVVITNHPGYGGSHLPDITLITPVFSPGGNLLGFVANRAHHAELGGEQPGSMPALARSLAQEGVVIPPTYLVRRGRARWRAVRKILVDAPFPSRAVEENLADIRAALAANRRGEQILRKMARDYGEETIRHYQEALKQKAERKIREAFRNLPDGVYEAEERLDDGSPLRVRLKIEGDRAEIDFSGTAPVHPGNLNATPAIVRSVIVYVLRLLVNEPLPLNEGLMRAVEVKIPPGLLNPDFPADPWKAPAVVGGNVETSQRLVDTLLKPLELVACSQGTMNNTVWGTAEYSYYETVCGGCGAGPNFDGASAVHSHMTNTRITDPEIIEYRYPVRVERFAIRRGSGGKGAHRGGDGVVREITFLQPMSLSVLTQHRKVRPYGLRGGEPGAPGRQRIVRASGEEIDLGPVDGIQVQAGDRFILETPGGGGFGKAESSREQERQGSP
ncbi:MAG TPA: 5-oxoprolinase, partial [Bacteroidetes bacterium]|nr:5-oxoprolinase [Bacteroidota bacterium]